MCIYVRSGAILLLVAGLLIGCGDDSSPTPAAANSGGEGGGGGKEDGVNSGDPPAFACQVEGATPAELAQKSDPIAEFVLKQGEGCPSTLGEMLEKLEVLDSAGCEGGDGAGLVTRIVADDARLGETFANYRTVTTRACGGRQPHEFVFTILGVSADMDMKNASGVEMMAFDRNTQQYNYYVMGDPWSFEASSFGLIEGEASCTSCHPSGGIIMKELDRPWVHWEFDTTLPGVDEIFANHGPLMGARGNGEDLEEAVREGNALLNVARVKHYSDPQTGDLRQLLRPLFCGLEINLDTAGEQPDAPITGIPFDALVDPFFLTGTEEDRGRVTVSDAVYEAAVDASGQSVSGTAAKDTAFKFVFPERSGIDVDYVQALIDAGVVDREFVADVLAVDFTRPLFSEERCALLGFAPIFGDPAATEMEGDNNAMTGDNNAMMGDNNGEPVEDERGDCCTPHAMAGCSNPTIQECVCAQDDFCCNMEWDVSCASGVGDFMCAEACEGLNEGGGDVNNSVGPDPASSSSARVAQATPETLRAAFLANIDNPDFPAGAGAVVLRANLESQGDADAHAERVAAFLTACEDRDEEGFMRDVLSYTNLTRDTVRSTSSIIEHPSQMPSGIAAAFGAKLDPRTCELVSP